MRTAGAPSNESSGTTSQPARLPQRSLRWELIGTLAIVLMMAVVSLSFATELLGQKRHHEQEIQRIRDHSRGLLPLIAADYSGGQFDQAMVRRRLRQSSTQLGIVLELHHVGTKDSELIESTGFGRAIAAAPTGESRVDTRLMESHNLLVIDEPLWLPNGPREGSWVLRTLAEPSPWTSEHDWPETLTVALGVGLVLLVLGGLMIQAQVLRPLRIVERAASQVAEGNLHSTVPEEGPREFHELAQAFNAMTRALRDQHKKIEQQASRLQRSTQLAAIGTLAAGVAHEVGNPLAAVIGYTELLLDPRSDAPLSGEQSNLLERIQNQTQRIHKIVGQLLDFSRPAHGALLALSPLNHLKETLALVSADPRLTSVDFQLRGAAELQVMADPAMLEQVFLNLLINAGRAATSGLSDNELENVAPRVRITIAPADPPDSMVRIEVQDNGAGVDDEHRATIFEPFFTTSTAGEGTGLGLAISLTLVEGMGGTLTCLDRGTRSPIVAGDLPGAVFQVQLPLAPT